MSIQTEINRLNAAKETLTDWMDSQNIDYDEGANLTTIAETISDINIPNVLNVYSDSQIDTYSCDYVNKLNNYSTTEQKTGETWIDGKPLYRKVIQHSGFAGTQVINIATITGAETILIKNTYLKSTNDTNLVYPLNMVGYAGNLTDKVYVYSEKEIIKGYSSGGWSTIWQLVVIVEYTKTTD